MRLDTFYFTAKKVGSSVLESLLDEASYSNTLFTECGVEKKLWVLTYSTLKTLSFLECALQLSRYLLRDNRNGEPVVSVGLFGSESCSLIRELYKLEN